MNTKDWPRFVRDCPLETGTRRAVLEALAHFADGEGVVRVSHAALALRAGCSERSVTRAAKELCEDLARLGMVRLIEAGDGRGRVSVYALALEVLAPIGPAVAAAKGAIRAGAAKALADARLTGKPVSAEAGLEVFRVLRAALEGEQAFDTLAVVEGFERIFIGRARRQVEDQIVRWSAHLRAVEKAGQASPESLCETRKKGDRLSSFLALLKGDKLVRKGDKLVAETVVPPTPPYKDIPTESASRAEAGVRAGAPAQEAPADAAGVVCAWLRELGDHRTPEFLEGAEFGLAGDRLVVAQPSAFSRSRLEADSGLGPVCRRLGLARVKLVERLEGEAFPAREMQARLDGEAICIITLHGAPGDTDVQAGDPSPERDPSRSGDQTGETALSATHREAEGEAGGQTGEGSNQGDLS